jgi:hypothetical protein
MVWGIPNGRAEIGRKARRDAASARAYIEMMEAGGVPPGQGLDHFEEGTGIAINPQERLVLLLDGEVYKSYDYEGVRVWDSLDWLPCMADGGCQPGGPMTETVEAGRAKRVSKTVGLVVSVPDREIPMWRISMRDKVARSRWVEMLSQGAAEDVARSLVCESNAGLDGLKNLHL